MTAIPTAPIPTSGALPMPSAVRMPHPTPRASQAASAPRALNSTVEPSVGDVFRMRSVPAPRIADMSHLSSALHQIANESTRPELSKLQFDGAKRAIADGQKLLSRNLESVTAATAAGRLSSTQDLTPNGLRSLIEDAHTKLGELTAMADAVQPEKHHLRRATFTFPSTAAASIREAAQAVAQAEAGAARLSGDARYTLRMTDQDVLDIPKSATDEARQDPDFQRAMDRRFLPIQRPVKNLGRVVGRLMEGGVEVIGGEKIPENGPFIMAPTHARMTDGPVWLSFLGKESGARLRPMMKSGIGPVGGALERVLATGGVFTVDTGTSKGDLALATGRELLRKGDAVVIYPEGRLVNNDLVGQAKDGIARLALDMDVPIYPVAVYGTKKAEIHGQSGRGVTMIVGDPIRPSGAPNSHHNVGVVRDQLQRSLVSLYREAGDRWRTTQAEKSGVTYDEAIAMAQ